MGAKTKRQVDTFACTRVGEMGPDTPLVRRACAGASRGGQEVERDEGAYETAGYAEWHRREGVWPKAKDACGGVVTLVKPRRGTNVNSAPSGVDSLAFEA